MKIGNCLNAGSKKNGQADGFHLDALSKTINILDKNKSTMLTWLVENLKEKDPEFEMKFKLELGPVYLCTKYKVDDIKKEIEKK